VSETLKEKYFYLQDMMAKAILRNYTIETIKEIKSEESFTEYII